MKNKGIGFGKEVQGKEEVKEITIKKRRREKKVGIKWKRRL